MLNDEPMGVIKALLGYPGSSRTEQLADAGRDAVRQWFRAADGDGGAPVPLDVLARSLLGRVASEAGAEDPSTETGRADAHAVAQGMADALGELALLFRYAVPAPKVEPGPWVVLHFAPIRPTIPRTCKAKCSTTHRRGPRAATSTGLGNGRPISATCMIAHARPRGVRFWETG